MIVDFYWTFLLKILTIIQLDRQSEALTMKILPVFVDQLRDGFMFFYKILEIEMDTIYSQKQPNSKAKHSEGQSSLTIINPSRQSSLSIMHPRRQSNMTIMDPRRQSSLITTTPCFPVYSPISQPQPHEDKNWISINHV